MAKQNKINKKRARRRYRAGQKAERLDMRQGGRVAFQRGGPRAEEEELMQQVQRRSAQQPVEMGRPPQQPVKIQPVVDKKPQPIEYSEEELGREININPDNIRMPGDSRVIDRPVGPDGKPITLPDGSPIPVIPPEKEKKPVFTLPIDPPSQPGDTPTQNIPVPKGAGLGTPLEGRPSIATPQRAERIARSSERIERGAQGELPIGAVIPDAAKVDETIEARTVQIDERPDVIGQRADVDLQEQVATGTATAAPLPDQITAGSYQADQTGAATADAAQGVISDKAEMTEDEIAEAANVIDVAPIEGADVEIPVGALTDRVVGVMSESAKSVAAKNTGSSLRKLSRAKKQLRKAGLTEDQIGEIGDDIESLEDRLDDFTEEQRGLIAGVDRDTLVDAQMSRLLDGMEEGEIPLWAQGAVGQVEQMLAARGLSASSVGRASLTNAILQSALPMAQSNATALQQAATQQRDIESRESESNAARRQQTALTNANNVFQMDMAQFSSDQQIALSNSKFLQTVGLTEANTEQQAAVQNAVIQSQVNLAEADAITKLTAQNAQAFLQMDMANLSSRQQTEVLNAQMLQQSMLSNQAATNASRQFNAASENQTNQFMANLSTQVQLQNAARSDAMSQFNATQSNAAEARRVANTADLAKFNSQLAAQNDQFNSQQDFARDQWNAANSQAVIQSNTAWRRQANTVNTAAQNQINMQNAQNAFGMSMQAQSFLWQELRDQADYDFKAYENDETRKVQLIATAMGNESEAASKWQNNTNVQNSISKILGT